MPLNYVTMQSEGMENSVPMKDAFGTALQATYGEETIIMAIDSSRVVAEKGEIAIVFRVLDISMKNRDQPRRITMSSRGEILDATVVGQEVRGRRPASPKLPEGVKRVVSDSRLVGRLGFPLLPEEEVRPGNTWKENFHLGKNVGDGVLLIPVEAIYRYQGDVMLQERNCAILTFELAGKLELPGEKGGTLSVAGEGRLVFDYENGVDVRVHKRFVETEISNREGERPLPRVVRVDKRLSEIPLLRELTPDD